MVYFEDKLYVSIFNKEKAGYTVIYYFFIK